MADLAKRSLSDHYLPGLPDFSLPPGTKDLIWGAAIAVVAVGALVTAGPEIAALELVELGAELSWGAARFGLGVAEAVDNRSVPPEALKLAETFASPVDAPAFALAHILLSPEQTKELEQYKGTIDFAGGLKDLSTPAKFDKLRSYLKLSDQDNKDDEVSNSDNKTDDPSSERGDNN